MHKSIPKKEDFMFPLQLNDQIIQSLSKNELKILQYVYGHSSETCEMSIHEFSRVISYSPATVLRFCRKLGFSGFAEFKYALRTNASRQPDQESVDSASKKLPTSISMERQVMISAMFNNISGTSHLISQDLLERTFAFFDSDCPIYIFSPAGITEIPCDYFEKLLFSIGRQNVYRTASARMCEHLLYSVNRKALLILVSTSGNFGPTERLARIASTNNIPILAITPYSSNSIASLADISYRFFTDQRENNGAEFTSRLPIFYIICAIINCYLDYIGDRETQFCN